MGAARDRTRQTGQLCDLDAVAVVRRAADDAAQERDILAALFDSDVVVLDALNGTFQIGQLVVVGGKERFAAQTFFRVGDMLDNGSGDAHAVKSRRTTANFVQNDQALRGGIFQNFGDLGHLDHEGGLSGGEVVRCADTGEDGVHDAHMALRCRNEGADLRHQCDEGVLTHIRRFTSHVGAGDDETAVFSAIQGGIVRHEETALEHLFDHRVTALDDAEFVALVHDRAAVVVLGGDLRQCRQNVQLGDGVGGSLDAVELTADGAEQFGEELVFQRDEPLVRAQNLAFQLFQLLRDVAFAGGEGLFADVGLRHHAFIGVADLDEVAENVVVADFQLGDAGLLPQTGLELGEDALGVIPDGTQFVHLGVVARGDDAAIFQGGGGFRVNGRVDFGLDVVQRVDFGRKLGQFRAAAALGQLFQVGQTVAGLRHCVDLFRGGGTVDGSGHHPLEVGDVPQFLDEVAALHGLADKAFDHVQAAVDGRAGHQRLFDPAAEHPLAHRGTGLVQHPEQRSPFFAAAQSLCEFEVGPGDRRKAHELGLIVADDGLQTLDTLDLRCVQILEKGRHREPHQTIRRDAGLVGPVAAKLIFEGDGDEAGRIAFFLDQLHRTGHILFNVSGDLPAVQQTRVHQHFAGTVAAELRNDRRGDLLRVRGFQLSDVRRTGGDIGKADTGFAILQKDAGDIVVFIVLQHAALDDRTRRDDPDDIPFDKALCLGRVFDLLTDGDLVALRDELCHIALVAVERHAAHGCALFQTALFAGQGQIQLPGCRFGIVKEHLVEIADAVEQDLIFMLFFYLKILLHHR